MISQFVGGHCSLFSEGTKLCMRHDSVLVIRAVTLYSLTHLFPHDIPCYFMRPFNNFWKIIASQFNRIVHLNKAHSSCIPSISSSRGICSFSGCVSIKRWIKLFVTRFNYFSFLYFALSIYHFPKQRWSYFLFSSFSFSNISIIPDLSENTYATAAYLSMSPSFQS